MDWSNERYVRIYTRNTADLLAIGWQGRLVWYELLRAADRSGLIDGGDEPAVLADMLRLPVDVLEPGLEAVLARKMAQVTTTPPGIVIPNYVEANETPMSSAMRSREHRERSRAEQRVMRRDVALSSQNVSVEERNVPDPTHGGTPGDAGGRGATPYRAVPSIPSIPSVPSTPARACVPEKDNTWTVVTRLWEEQERLRHDADPNCRRMSLSTGASIAVEAILAEHTEEECLHVLAVVAADTKVRAKGARNWFDGVTNWKPDNFRRALAQPVAEVKREIEWSLPCLSGGLPIPGDGESDEAYATRRATWESEQAKG